jgi:hypothetical protein
MNTKNSTQLAKSVLILVAAFAFSPSLSAQDLVYNLNFNGGVGGNYLPNYTGTGAAPDLGTYWNQIQQTQNGIGNYSASFNSLLASDGTTSSGINVLVEYSRAYNDGGTAAGNLLGSWFQADDSVNGAGVARVVISGLAAGTTYDLYTYGINGGFTGRGTRFIINNNNWTGGTADGPSYNWLQTTGASASSFQEVVNYVTFSGVQSFNGNIEFYIGANPVGLWAPGAINTQGPFNGLQLVATAIPEPSTYALVLGGIAALIAVRRRLATRS